MGSEGGRRREGEGRRGASHQPLPPAACPRPPPACTASLLGCGKGRNVSRGEPKVPGSILTNGHQAVDHFLRRQLVAARALVRLAHGHQAAAHAIPHVVREALAQRLTAVRGLAPPHAACPSGAYTCTCTPSAAAKRCVQCRGGGPRARLPLAAAPHLGALGDQLGSIVARGTAAGAGRLAPHRLVPAEADRQRERQGRRAEARWATGAAHGPHTGSAGSARAARPGGQPSAHAALQKQRPSQHDVRPRPHLKLVVFAKQEQRPFLCKEQNVAFNDPSLKVGEVHSPRGIHHKLAAAVLVHRGAHVEAGVRPGRDVARRAAGRAAGGGRQGGCEGRGGGGRGRGDREGSEWAGGGLGRGGRVGSG